MSRRKKNVIRGRIQNNDTAEPETVRYHGNLKQIHLQISSRAISRSSRNRERERERETERQRDRERERERASDM